jgi:hypothetical protein
MGRDGAGFAKSTSRTGRITADIVAHAFCNSIITASGSGNALAGATTRYARPGSADQFFITFCFWASLFCLYMLATLIAYLTIQIDGQMIAIIALSALFGIFTTSMFGSHVYLIMTGKTTVESFAAQDQGQHESRYLQSHLGWMGSREASKAKKMWRREWGGSSIDERWRVGGAFVLWKQEMGAHWYEWICKSRLNRLTQFPSGVLWVMGCTLPRTRALDRMVNG